MSLLHRLFLFSFPHRFVTASRDGSVRLWSKDAKEPLSVLSANDDAPYETVQFNIPNNR